jgi:formylglycine-generating enzyme required for sulfatase activity
MAPRTTLTDEVGRRDVETQHRVTLTQGFWLGKYPVTQAQWQAVMGSNPSSFIGPNLPVEEVSWNAISESGGFLEKINGFASSGGFFSLPTEAQWEYACRAKTVTALHNGKNLTTDLGPCPNLDEVAWYRENSKYEEPPVGQKKANRWGLHDMQGSVREWCVDWYASYPDGVQVDPLGPDSGLFRVIRGGSLSSLAINCRVAFRLRGDPAYALSSANFVGFRVARSSVPQ